MTSVHSENWAAIDSSLRLTVSAGAVHTMRSARHNEHRHRCCGLRTNDFYEAKRNGRNRAVVGF